MNGLHEAMNGLHEAMNGLHEAMNGLHEAMNGFHEAMNGFHEAMNGFHEAMNGLHEAMNGFREAMNGLQECAASAGIGGQGRVWKGSARRISINASALGLRPERLSFFASFAACGVKTIRQALTSRATPDIP
jgi:hypothetical protein